MSFAMYEHCHVICCQLNTSSAAELGKASRGVRVCRRIVIGNGYHVIIGYVYLAGLLRTMQV